MDHELESPDKFRRSCPRRSVRTALPPAACSPASCDAGRAAAGRAGSFNSGKNLNVSLFKFTPPSQVLCTCGQWRGECVATRALGALGEVGAIAGPILALCAARG